MGTHCKEILKADAAQAAAGLAEHRVTVRLQSSKPLEDGQTMYKTSFACCLVCGGHEHCVVNKWRYEHAKWCEKCRAPFDEQCETCCAKTKRIQNTELNRCDEFIVKHERQCGRDWATVTDWYDAKKPAPGKLKLTDRKTERKMLRKPQGTPSPQTTAVQPAAPVSGGPPRSDDRPLRDLIAKLFPEEFDKYYVGEESDDDEEYDEDDIEERDEQRGMTTEEMLRLVAKRTTSVINTLRKAKADMEPTIRQRVKTATASYEQQQREMDEELCRERGKQAQLMAENERLRAALADANRAIRLMHDQQE
jgi:hypothetical protein